MCPAKSAHSPSSAEPFETESVCSAITLQMPICWGSILSIYHLLQLSPLLSPPLRSIVVCDVVVVVIVVALFCHQTSVHLSEFLTAHSTSHTPSHIPVLVSTHNTSPLLVSYRTILWKPYRLLATLHTDATERRMPIMLLCLFEMHLFCFNCYYNFY